MRLFLLADGAIIVVGLLFFLWAFLRKKNENHFRDDLWKNIRDPEKRAQAKLAFEDQVDKKILIEQKNEAPPSHQAGTVNEFRFPNFQGKPHEVLGIPADANAELVNRAHRHWIKKYHPDRVTHLGGLYVEQARRRAEQLNSARQKMLEKR